MYDCYIGLEIDWANCEYYEYNVKTLEYGKFFTGNWDKRMEAKANKDAFGTAIYKLYNNSLYGKTAEKKRHDILTMKTNEFGGYSLEEESDGKEADLNAAITYFPVAIAITSYGRCRLGAFGKCVGFENVIKTDTDSLFFIRNKKSQNGLKKINLKNELNGWGNENEVDCIKFSSLGGKRYKELFADNKPKFTCCGISKGYIERLLNNKEASGLEIYNSIDIVSGEFEATTFLRDYETGAKMIISKAKMLSFKEESLWNDWNPKMMYD